MHDPMVVAFDIPRPWPRRERSHDAKPGQPRWRIRLHRYCGDDCGEQHRGNPFPWWKPDSYSKFWVLAGRGWYWPEMITVWHCEPGGHDSGTVCRHYRHEQLPDGTYRTERLTSWRWHIHHWRLRFPPLQALRRKLLTRCTWCGGRSRRGDQVNVRSGSTPRGPWWRGERGLYHVDCSSVEHAHKSCACDKPLVQGGGRFGMCMLCGQYAAGQPSKRTLVLRRALAAVPAGHRDPDMWKRITEAHYEERVS